MIATKCITTHFAKALTKTSNNHVAMSFDKL